MVHLPKSIEHIDADWLSQALQLRFPGTEVLRVTFGTSVRATGTKVRMLLEYNDAGHAHRLPATMWFKGGYEDHSDHVRTSHARESLFYDEIEPLGLVNAPKTYFAGIDDDTGFGAQLIEDLLQRNARFGDARNPLAVSSARQALEQMARLHAHWWNSPELVRLGPVGGSLATDGIVLRILTEEAWNTAMASGKAADLPIRFHDQTAAVAAMKKLWEIDRASQNLCMVHGDPHPGNLFYEQDGTPGFLDWQRLMQCDWAHDVNYFMVSSLAVEDCEAHEEALVRHYLDTLAEQGVKAPAWDEAWLSYRQHAAYGLVWNIVPTVMQRKEIVDVEAKRFNAAVTRLDTYGAVLG